MTIEEIKQYFGGNAFYRFNGTAAELAELQDRDVNSYNYIVADYVIYFSPERPVSDERAILFTTQE